MPILHEENPEVFVDDSPLDHFILKRILNKYQLDYEVNCTADGEEVLGISQAQHRLNKLILPDIILLDLYMPRFDGWLFLEKMQQVYPHFVQTIKTVRVVVIHQPARYSIGEKI